MNGTDEYSNYVGPEPTDEQVQNKVFDIYEGMSYEDIEEMYIEEMGRGVGHLIAAYREDEILEHIEDKVRRGEYD